MTYTIFFRPKARKAFLAIPRHVRLKLEARLEALAEDPRAGDTRKLTARGDTMRLRVDDYRILYLVDHQERTVDVVKVAPRGGAYR